MIDVMHEGADVADLNERACTVHQAFFGFLKQRMDIVELERVN